MEIDPNSKILIDADVLIHFYKGEQIGMLHKIYPNQIILLDIVFNEVFIGSLKTVVENLIKYKMIEEEKLDDCSLEVRKEYYALSREFGKGESAIMAYCKFNKEVLASSNLSDIKKYCEHNKITYLTTMDFLAEAFKNQVLTEKECDQFIKDVKTKGSKLIHGVNFIRDYRR